MSGIVKAVADPKNAAVVNAIRSVAGQLGVDANLALATAYRESGFDPTAVGDQGTSFGIYQLHRGGELGTLTQAQANDPTRNAQVSLSVVRSVAGKMPGASPGTIAAAAQRPADRAGYASAVDSLYSELGGTYLPTLPVTPALPSLNASGGATATASGVVDNEGPLFVWHIPTTSSDISLQRGTVRKILGGAIMVTGGVLGLAGAFLITRQKAPGLAGAVQGVVSRESSPGSARQASGKSSAVPSAVRKDELAERRQAKLTDQAVREETRDTAAEKKAQQTTVSARQAGAKAAEAAGDF